MGIALGLLSAWALTRLMQPLLFGVSATDPLTLSVGALSLALVAWLACYLPARRAIRLIRWSLCVTNNCAAGARL